MSLVSIEQGELEELLRLAEIGLKNQQWNAKSRAINSVKRKAYNRKVYSNDPGKDRVRNHIYYTTHKEEIKERALARRARRKEQANVT